MELKDTFITPSFNNSIVQFLLLLALLRNSDWTFKHLIIIFSHKVVLYDLLPINSYIFGPLALIINILYYTIYRVRTPPGILLDIYLEFFRTWKTWRNDAFL